MITGAWNLLRVQVERQFVDKHVIVQKVAIIKLFNKQKYILDFRMLCTKWHGEKDGWVKQNFDELSDIYVPYTELFSNISCILTTTYRRFVICIEIGQIIFFKLSRISSILQLFIHCFKVTAKIMSTSFLPFFKGQSSSQHLQQNCSHNKHDIFYCLKKCCDKKIPTHAWED